MSEEYYFDSKKGSDHNDGLSPESPWKSFANLKNIDISSISRIFLASGATFNDNLVFEANFSGRKGNEIIISSYGEGQAELDADDGTAIKLYKSSNLIIKNIKLKGKGRKAGNNGCGIELVQTDNILIDNVEVSGFRIAGIRTSGDRNTTIKKVYAHDNGGAGIEICGWDENFSENIHITSCITENNPGDPEKKDNHSGNGIIVGNAKKVLVEYCVASNNGWDMPRQGNGPVGIWGWNCDSLIIQYCISHDNKSPGFDGGGFDLDGGCTNSIIQYNLSYNNYGAGYLLCQYPGASEWKNNILRNNISFNDGLKNTNSGIHVWVGDKNFSKAQIYKNIIINPKYAVSAVYDIPNFDYFDYSENIFISGKELIYGLMKGARFEGNLYWQTGIGDFCLFDGQRFSSLEEWARITGQEMKNGKLVGVVRDPRITIPENTEELKVIIPEDLKKMKLFRFDGEKKSVFE
ncbi:MAG TPA: right-handed parallel beta-helix repeat-containing protein [Victivallales bacterium]|nr:right-handed parallel beta-helix repeat-containing protein [Victivallales bacterium]HPO91075.1 right-handed parallel beta-helix repeat-containing protein [Victivallales bacterium]HRR28874.1 right-handed parallel beta-helix repeat-containing protein [Victivallales bacterium]